MSALGTRGNDRQEDDVSPEEFLRHVRELGVQKDMEDRKRAEDLEREIQRSREARRARRAGELLILPFLVVRVRRLCHI
jgi:hypothetical protein